MEIVGKYHGVLCTLNHLESPKTVYRFFCTSNYVYARRVAANGGFKVKDAKENGFETDENIGDKSITGILQGSLSMEESIKSFQITEKERKSIRAMLKNELFDSNVSVILDDDHERDDKENRGILDSSNTKKLKNRSENKKLLHKTGLEMRKFVERNQSSESVHKKMINGESYDPNATISDISDEENNIPKYLTQGRHKYNISGKGLSNVYEDNLEDEDFEAGPEFFDERGRKIDVQESNDKSIIKNRIFPTLPDTNPQSKYKLGPIGFSKLRSMTRYVDAVRCMVNGGSGGDGAISFFPSKMLSVGPPSGGSGGRGANVYLEASRGIKTLRGMKTIYSGPNGKSGSSKQMNGIRGQDLVVRVPVGTHGKITHILRNHNIPFGERLPNDANKEEKLDFLSRFFTFKDDNDINETRMEHLIEKANELEDLAILEQEKPRNVEFDLTNHGDRILISNGGLGGLGNPFYHIHGLLASRVAGKGRPGDSVILELEMQTLADAGLVGLPNAGKSTFVSAISNANPKIAPYAFTTLTPYLGTLQFDDSWSMTVADIPGIIEGAHANMGLGHEFLRHIVRSNVLIYIVDISGKDPCKDFDILKNELERYKLGLTKRASIIIANKADKDPQITKSNFLALQKHAKEIKVVPVSSKEQKNINSVCRELRRIVKENREVQ